jgi:hypothetical protein
VGRTSCKPTAWVSVAVTKVVVVEQDAVVPLFAGGQMTSTCGVTTVETEPGWVTNRVETVTTASTSVCTTFSYDVEQDMVSKSVGFKGVWVQTSVWRNKQISWLYRGKGGSAAFCRRGMLCERHLARGCRRSRASQRATCFVDQYRSVPLVSLTARSSDSASLYHCLHRRNICSGACL